MAEALSVAAAIVASGAPPASVRIELAPLPHFGAVSLRLDPGDAAGLEVVRECLGASPPPAPGWSEGSGAAALWQAFDEWLILVEDGREHGVLDRLRQALAGRHHAVTDVSDQYAAIEVKGSEARALLAKGCAADLHPRAFAGRACAVASLARVRVTLRLTGDAPAFQVIVERSYAQYLWDWLADAAREFA